MTPTTTPPRYVTLVLLAALSTMTLNMFLPSLAAIAEDLDAPYAIVSLAVGVYLAMTAVVQLIVGPWSDRIGRRPVVLRMLVIFVIASLGASLAANVYVFLAFRMMQAAVLAGYSVAMAIVRDTSERQEAASRLGYIAMAMAVAPMIGPMIGGTLDSLFGWRANFYAYGLAGLSLLLWCWYDLGETHTPGQSQNRQRTALLKEPRFWAYAICGAFSTGAFFVFLASVPLIATLEFGMTSATLGVAIGSITLGFMTGGFLSGRLAARAAPLRLMLIGRLCPMIGLSIGLILSLFLPMTPALLFVTTLSVGLGNGLTMPSANAGAMSVNAELAGSAAGLSGAMNVGTGAVLTAIAGALVTIWPSPQFLIVLMLLTSSVALAMVLWLRRLEPQST